MITTINYQINNPVDSGSNTGIELKNVYKKFLYGSALNI